MTRVRVRGEVVRRFILEHVETHPNDIGKITSDHFRITRQAVNKHLKKLKHEGALSEEGRTRNRSYALAPKAEWAQTYQILPDLEEHVLWQNDFSALIGQQPENVLDIWQYGLTEMINNARDHSSGTELLVMLRKTAVYTEMAIIDNGIGIFRKIQAALNLADERHAVFELSKGKLTTDPKRHTGEGIFFTSRMFDFFDIYSGGVSFSHEYGTPEDWIMEQAYPRDGTAVWLKLNNHTARTLKKVFDQYTSGDDFGFTKTVVPVKLAQYGNDKLISRSQAKRVIARVELFKTVVFDFANVPMIGQAFADEIFRVFAHEHPEIEIVPIHQNSEVKRMIAPVLLPFPQNQEQRVKEKEKDGTN
jgi:anti-sigma regulatory factor (Ser/Thr protein kinase)/biotin operon repressor